MASIVMYKKKKSVSFGIQYHFNGQRECICFPKRYTKRQVEEFAQVVESVVAALETGRSLTTREQNRLDEVSSDKRVRQKFSDKGLIEPFENLNLGGIFDRFLRDYPKENFLKQSSITTYELVMVRLLEYFHYEHEPNVITKKDCMAWLHTLEEKYAEATLATTVRRCRTIFGWAVQRGYIETNPFIEIKGYSDQNKKNERFIPITWYRRLLEACPDQSWRTIISLCRIGGLRNPSETLKVQWKDIDWDKMTLCVYSSKTERYRGKECRVIPIWPELREELKKQQVHANPTECPFVIDRYRDSAAGMAAQMRKIIFYAGLEEWPRLFHNLRGSRSNELFSKYPPHVAAAWMGQSVKVAIKHYLHPTEEQIKNATQDRME